MNDGAVPAYDKWEARQDMETLLRAEQIKKDPHRMKCVQRAAKEKLQENSELKQLASGKKP